MHIKNTYEEGLVRLPLPSTNGLFHGRSGAVLLYAVMYQHTGQQSYHDMSMELLEDICAGLAEEKELNFMNGLSGIGWLVEWLVQEKLLELNTDEFLEDIDDELYKSVVFASATNPGLDSGAIGKAMYFLKRYQSKNPGAHYFKSVCHLECLILLLDDIKAALLGPESLILRDPEAFLRDQQSIHHLADGLLFAAKVSSLQISTAVTEDILYNVTNYIRKYCIHVTGFVEGVAGLFPATFLRLAYACWFAGGAYGVDMWADIGYQLFDKIYGVYGGDIGEDGLVRQMMNRMGYQDMVARGFDGDSAGPVMLAAEGRRILAEMSSANVSLSSWDECWLLC